MTEQPTLQKIMSQLGLSKSLQRIKFGGVVGKQSLLGIFGAMALASIAWRADPKDGLKIAILAAAVLIVIAILNHAYAHQHPVEATLEGTEMIVMQQQILAAKSLQPPSDSSIIPNPGGAPPQSNPPGDVES